MWATSCFWARSFFLPLTCILSDQNSYPRRPKPTHCLVFISMFDVSLDHCFSVLFNNWQFTSYRKFVPSFVQESDDYWVDHFYKRVRVIHIFHFLCFWNTRSAQQLTTICFMSFFPLSFSFSFIKILGFSASVSSILEGLRRIGYRSQVGCLISIINNLWILAFFSL